MQFVKWKILWDYDGGYLMEDAVGYLHVKIFYASTSLFLRCIVICLMANGYWGIIQFNFLTYR